MSENTESGSAQSVGKKVSMACDRCRSSKLKCDGMQPCYRCTQHQAVCAFSRTDGRHREDLKRKIEELQDDSDLLQNLLETFRNVNDQQVKQITSLVRSNPSLDEVKVCVKEVLIDLRMRRRQPSPELRLIHEKLNTHDAREIEDSVASGSASGKSSKLQILRLIDHPLVTVPSQPWTDVTTDDALVSHILSAWMTWEKPFYNWIDMDPCLHDMQVGEARARYCSPFLFNALMAYGCSFARYAETRAVNGAPSKLMESFLGKAKSLIPPEDNEEDLLTTAQGLMCLFLAESIAGKDGTAFEKYALRAGRVCERLPTRYDGLERSTGKHDMTLFRAIYICCWGVYNQIVMTSWIYRRRCSMEPPVSLGLLPPIVENEGTWRPYPDQDPERPSCEFQLLHQRSTLSLIVKDLAIYFEQYKVTPQAAGPDDLIRTPHELLGRLLQWHSDLPKHLHVTVDSTASVLVHHAYYLSVLITLCSVEMSESPECEDLMQRTRPQALRATLELVDIFRIHEKLYGNTVACVYLVHPLSIVLNMLLEHNEAGIYDAEITDLCIFLAAMSRRFPFAFAVLRMLQISARERKKTLPYATEKLFEDFITTDWVNRRLVELDSLYPVDSVNVVSSLPTPQNMTDFIALLDELGIDDVR